MKKHKPKGITVTPSNVVRVFNKMRKTLRKKRKIGIEDCLISVPITQFPSGAIRDSQEGKTDFTETISWTALNAYAKYMTGKKAKYGAGNFKKGIEDWSYEQSLIRHIDKYMRNKYENGNDEKDELHLEAIVFNAFGLIHNREQRKLSPPKKLS